MITVFAIGLFALLCVWFTTMVVNMIFDEIKEFKEKLKGDKGDL